MTLMVANIIFFVAVLAAVLAVILLALVSPSPANRKSHFGRPWLAFSLYIHPPPHSHHMPPPRSHEAAQPADAYIFRQRLTQGPKNTSRVIGKAQGLLVLVPAGRSVLSATFNVIHLSFDKPECYGSLVLEADYKEQLAVVGGTGAFAFARGEAVSVRIRNRETADAIVQYHYYYYCLKLRLRFPDGVSTTHSRCSCSWMTATDQSY